MGSKSYFSYLTDFHNSMVSKSNFFLSCRFSYQYGRHFFFYLTNFHISTVGKSNFHILPIFISVWLANLFFYILPIFKSVCSANLFFYTLPIVISVWLLNLLSYFPRCLYLTDFHIIMVGKLNLIYFYLRVIGKI